MKNESNDPTTLTAPPPARPRLLGLALAIGLLVMLALLTALAMRSLRSGVSDRPLPAVADVPEFSLVERSDRAVTKADLLGKVWLADFVFTSCAGPCPEMTLRMKSLQRSLEGAGDDVKLVSFSIDPEFDTPAVLRRYADRYGADPQRWWFLTGPSRDEMHALVKEGFLQAVTQTGDSVRYVHSTRFVLVDRKGRIRAWYDGLEAESKPQILHDIQRLLSEPPEP